MLSKGQKIGLIVAGFVALAGGIGYLMFRKSKRDELPDMGGFPPYRDDSTSSSSSSSSKNEETVAPPKPTADEVLNEVIKKESRGDGAKAVQVIINQIANWRGWNGTTRKSSNGVNVKFPIGQDGIFGNQSDAAARLIFDSYKNTGSITRHNARLKWAYAQGFYGKPLDANLKNKTRTAEYEREWNNGSKARK